MGEVISLLDKLAEQARKADLKAYYLQKASRVATIKRPVTADDILNLGNLNLEDFAVDFSSVKRPPPGEMDEMALRAYADDLCRAMGMKV
ncbi:MAG: hypothetical protein WBL28_08030 [Methylotenera sp.]